MGGGVVGEAVVGIDVGSFDGLRVGSTVVGIILGEA